MKQDGCEGQRTGPGSPLAQLASFRKLQFKKCKNPFPPSPPIYGPKKGVREGCLYTDPSLSPSPKNLYTHIHIYMAPQRGPTYAPTLGAGRAKPQGLGVVEADVRGQGTGDTGSSPQLLMSPEKLDSGS